MLAGVLRDAGFSEVVRRLVQLWDARADPMEHRIEGIGYRGLTIRQVVALDLKRLSGGPRFLGRLRRARPDVVRLLRERVAFLSRRGGGQFETTNAKRLTGWIDYLHPRGAGAPR